MSSYKYPFAIFPRGTQLLQKELMAAAMRLAKKLALLKWPENGISPFIKTYFSRNLNYLQATLQRSTYLFAWALHPYFFDSGFKKINLVDYGGGSGMLSLFAKELGIGKVIYVDIYDVCCRDALFIAQALNLKADHYINGGVNELLSFLRRSNISCYSVVSYDTLEHIYDIEDFLEKITLVSRGPLVLALASGANPFNPIISKRIMKLQRKVEFEGKRRQVGEDQRNPEEPLISLRRKIIVNKFPTLPQTALDILAKKTRGLRSDDIVEAVELFLSKNKLPEEIVHPTNTCDPITGNWCERLLNPCILGEQLETKGFKVKVLSGYYGTGGNDAKWKRFARIFANFLVAISGKFGLRIAPYYFIYGDRQL